MEFTDKPLDPFGTELLAIEVESNLTFKMPLIFRLTRLLKENCCIDPALQQLVELCFDEALTNAMVHGNRLDTTKQVRVWLFCDDDNWGAIIEDDGEGFSPKDVPEPSEETLLDESGRGIMLMDGYLDTLLYSQKGNRVMMVRRREEGEETFAEVEESLAPPEEIMALDMDMEPEEAAIGAAPMPEEAPALEQEAEAAELAVAEEAEGEVSGFARVTQEDDIAVVEILVPRLSDMNVETLRTEVAAAIAQSQSIILDISRVNYISSVIIGVCAALYKQVKANKGDMKAVASHPVVVEVLKSARFDKLLDLQPDKESALAKMRG